MIVIAWEMIIVSCEFPIHDSLAVNLMLQSKNLFPRQKPT